MKKSGGGILHAGAGFFAALVLIFTLLSPAALASKPDFEQYIDDAFASGIILGDENGFFDSGKVATRAEFATIAVRFLGLNGGVNVFSDVSDSDWFAGSIAAAASRGMLAGYEDGRARPYAPISCEDAVTILGRYYDAHLTPTERVGGVSAYARSYFEYALENELFQHEEYAEPKHAVTKGEILALLYEYSRMDDKKIRFADGYPVLSESRIFSNISIDVKTNAPCTVFYTLKEAGTPGFTADEPLCVISEADSAGTVHIAANINKSYDIYLRAAEAGSTAGKVKVIKNVRPFPFPSGSGTEEEPYIIYSAEQLAGIGQNPDLFYRLGADIELKEPWTPIESFCGVLDGAGCRVDGLSINSGDTDAGLFALLDGGTVKNLTVSGDVSAKTNTGLIAGRSAGGVIEGCCAYGTVTAKTNNAGGICGQSSGRIKNCLSAVYSVSADSFAGGICGQSSGKIENCLSAAEAVVSQMCAGGISGANQSGTVTGCIAANMTVYNSMTYNSGKLTTNKQGGVTRGNYSYDGMISNASYEAPSELSQSGEPISWEELLDIEFYYRLGWERRAWHSAENGWRLACPSGAAAPELERGRTAYMPLAVSTPAELAAVNKNEAGHYIMTADITLTAPWKTICAKNGFSGTFDGNGYTVYNLNLKGEPGMFSNITGGTVRNLSLANVQASPSSNGAMLTACNYGYIKNCTVSGRLETKKAGTCGAIAGENFGEISGCTVHADITNNYDNSSFGGICGSDSGVISGCFYSGQLYAGGKNAVVGGICGYATGAYISDCFASAAVKLSDSSGYAGGICGAAEGVQLFKCASGGSITASGAKLYSGGICGAAEVSTVYSCLSAADINLAAKSAYTGGLCGFISGTNLQNCYSCGSIVAADGQDLFTGGICGAAEESFITANAAINPSIISQGACGAVIGSGADCETDGNFCCDRTLINSQRISSSNAGGEIKPLSVLKSAEFYFKPPAEGGQLGWDRDTWTEGGGRFAFPALSGVSGCAMLKMPVYK